MSEAAAPVRRRNPGRLVADVTVVLLVAAVLGLAAGLLWPQLADPVTVTRTGDGLFRDELALSEQFDALGWFTVVSAVGGLLLGAVMLAWRRTDELVTLVAVVVGAFLAAWIAAQLGLALGPEDPNSVLAGAAEGDTAPAQLSLGAPPQEGQPASPAGVVYWVWPLFAVLGALVYLVSPLSEHPLEEGVRAEGPGAVPVGREDGAVDVSGAPEGTPPSRP